MEFSIHSNFQLNGFSFYTDKELLTYSKSVSKSIFVFLSDFLSDMKTINVKTSGSTGIPKVITLKKEFMINSANATGIFFNLKEGTKALLCLNTNYIAGKMMLVRAMVLGWQLDVVLPSSNPLKNSEKRYDFTAMVPLQVFNSLNDLPKVKKLIIGGGIISKELEKKLQTIDTEVFATYGMTETITHIAIKRLGNKSFYKTLPSVKISKDKRKCLVINAPMVSENEIVTNDIIKIISESEFEWLGRFDNIINSGGIKLIPEQLEEKLSEIIEQRFFVTGIKDAVLGEKLVLVVEGNSEELKNIIFNRFNDMSTSLLKYETPKEIYIIKKFVETDTKKIQRSKTLDLIEV